MSAAVTEQCPTCRGFHVVTMCPGDFSSIVPCPTCSAPYPQREDEKMDQQDPTLHDPADLKNARDRGDCERCRLKPATVTVPHRIDSDEGTPHGLCDECYSDYQYEMASTNPEDEDVPTYEYIHNWEGLGAEEEGE